MNISLSTSVAAAVNGRRHVCPIPGRKVLAVLIALAPLSAPGQGNDNPTGFTGVFNGNSSTGCSYDPYTANATRTIPDLTVAGAVGSYPLQWARTMNSRAAGGGLFGQGGGWSHSYQWSCSATENSTGAPDSYTVHYPDGRWVTFDANVGTPYLAPPGVTDRFGGAPGDTFVYLYLTDGGKVRFWQDATYHPSIGGEPAWWDFVISAADQIIDPYGRITTLEYSGKLSKVTEPGGRYLKISYGTNGYVSEVDAYTAADHWTQWVKYTYATQTFGGTPYTVLTRADYIYAPGLEPAPIAYYTYQTSNTSPTGNPLISTCKDVRYPGPMKNIAYTFVRTNPLSYGQLSQEKNIDGTSIVATLAVSGATRTETRGDVPSGGSTPVRSFTYGTYLGSTGIYKAYLLKTYTDFAGHTTTLSYDANGYVSSIKDANNHTTSFERLPLSGVITKITHPGDGSTVQYVYTDDTGAYLDHMIDERGKQTTYKRTAGTMTTYEIDYPDGGIEKFTYSTPLGQVLTHTMPSNTSTDGAGTDSEKYSYDATGLLLTHTPPATTSDPAPSPHPMRYHYDINDHVDTITDPLAHVTTLYHNEIGQVTWIVYDNTDPGSVNYVYNADGTLDYQSVQLNATESAVTDYVYDDYKRVLNVTDPTDHVTNFWYHKDGNAASDLRHTDANVTRLVSPLPSGKVTKTVYDANWRKDTVTVGFGTGDAATTNYDYDAVGNLTKITDPKLHAWNYFYDERNRLIGVDDPISTDRNNNTPPHTVSYTYDAASNKTLEERANDQNISYAYNEMNRLTQMTVPQSSTVNDITYYSRTNFGKLNSMTDPRGNVYTYDYDRLNRLVTTHYPADGGGTLRTETYSYDWAGNLTTFKNRAGSIQTFIYDSRNRETKNSWSNGNPQPRTITYDQASRMTSCNTIDAVTSAILTGINFAYYKDGALKSQEEWGTSPTYGDGIHRTISYTYDADGNRASVTYPGIAAFTSQYTARNQLASLIWTGDNGHAVDYVYDTDGRMTSRTLQNGTSSVYTPDALDRVTHITFNFTGATGQLSYAYDEVGNRKYAQRGTGLTDGFSYNLNDEITTFQRDGTLSGGVVSGGTVTNYVLDKSGNRTSVAVVGGTTTTYAAANGLNQYTTIGGVAVTNGPNGNSAYDSWSCGYDSMNRLTSADKGATTSDFFYDGLGRQVARVENGTTTYSVWDRWNLFAEYSGGVQTNRWVYAGNDLIRSPLPQGIYYYPDANGSNVYLADTSGNLLERYTYDAYGAPSFADENQVVLSATAYGVNHLFTGQRWYPALGIYDLRNRAYRPDIGRFLQPDPIGFAGDGANLYRYCGNNPANWSDPFGLDEDPPRKVVEGPSSNGDDSERIIVTGTYPGGGGVPFAGGSGGGHSGNSGEPGLNYDRAIDRNGRVYDASKKGLGVHDDPGAFNSDTVIVSGPLPIQPGFPTAPGGAGGSGGGNPYLDSAPFIAEYGKGFDRPGLQQLARVTNGFGIGAGVVIALPVAGPLALNGLYYGGWYGGAAATAAYQAALAHPGAVSQIGQAFNAFITPGGVPTDYATLVGQGANTIVNIYDPTFGP